MGTINHTARMGADHGPPGLDCQNLGLERQAAEQLELELRVGANEDIAKTRPVTAVRTAGLRTILLRSEGNILAWRRVGVNRT